LASAVAMDKPMAKRLFQAAGIPVADHVVTTIEAARAKEPMARPYVAKPMNEGSSVGVHIVREGDNEPPFEGSGWSYGELVMIERYIPGRELTVSVMGGKALAVTEITTARGFYDYDAKYVNGGSIHVIPAEVDKGVYDQAMDLSERAFTAIGCRGVARTDFRYDGDTLYMLEINTQPGMTPTSLVPEQAAHAGLSFQDLVVWMVEQAECD
ncbi:MAG: D-alanine--D-alanine ligase, partial [Rhodospirillales bacterium]